VSVLVDNEEENAVFLQLHISGLGIGKAFVKSKPGDKAGNQLGTPVGSKGFSERGPKFLKLCPIVAQLCPTHFSRGEKKIPGVGSRTSGYGPGQRRLGTPKNNGVQSIFRNNLLTPRFLRLSW